MLARSLYSHAEMQGKNVSALHEMIFQKGQNWNDLPIVCRRGRVIRRELVEDRNHWCVDVGAPIFTQDRQYLRNFVPVISYEDAK
jgi:hypothetical protein